MVFILRWERASRDEIARLPGHDRERIANEASLALASQPAKQEGKKKRIEGVTPRWAERPGFWQLSVGPYRVFYDVIDDERVVVVRAVRVRGRKKTEEIVQ